MVTPATDVEANIGDGDVDVDVEVDVQRSWKWLSEDGPQPGRFSQLFSRQHGYNELT
jgi:hypothetical protein